jgi:outer membrane protein TolC
MHFKLNKFLQKWNMFFLIYVLCIGLSQAETVSILSQLIQDASQNNPQINAARERWLAAKDTIPQSRSLPDPKISAGYPMNIKPMRLQMVGISQEIPFPAKLYTRGKVAASDANQAEAVYNSIRQTVITQIKKSYYDLYFVNKSIEILKTNLVILGKMEESSRINYSVGKTPQQDIYRAQTEISRLQMRLVMLRQERLSIQADINRNLNRSLEISVATPYKLHITALNSKLEHLYGLVETRSPQLQVQKKNIEKSSQKVKLSKFDYYPDIMIEAGKIRNTADNTQGYMAMLSLTVPLYFMSKQNYAVSESLSRYNADVEDLYSTHRDLSFQIKNSYLLVQRSGQLIELIRDTIIPQARLTFNSSRENYGVGNVDFMTMLNNLLTLQDNELELQAEIVQHEKAIAQIEEITGVKV